VLALVAGCVSNVLQLKDGALQLECSATLSIRTGGKGEPILRGEEQNTLVGVVGHQNGNLLNRVVFVCTDQIPQNVAKAFARHPTAARAPQHRGNARCVYARSGPPLRWSRRRSGLSAPRYRFRPCQCGTTASREADAGPLDAGAKWRGGHGNLTGSRVGRDRVDFNLNRTLVVAGAAPTPTREHQHTAGWLIERCQCDRSRTRRVIVSWRRLFASSGSLSDE
jgi:hypothetical protein